MRNVPLSDSSRSALCGCALFSATGILFTSWVGFLLIKQPLLVSGIENVEEAKKSAFGAAFAYFFTFLFCVLWMIRDSNRRPTIGRGAGDAVTSMMYRDGDFEAREHGDDDDFFPQQRGSRRPYSDYGQIPTAEQDLPDALRAPSTDRAAATLTSRARAAGATLT